MRSNRVTNSTGTVTKKPTHPLHRQDRGKKYQEVLKRVTKQGVSTLKAGRGQSRGSWKRRGRKRRRKRNQARGSGGRHSVHCPLG